MAKGNENPVPVGDRLTSKESLFYPSVQGEGWKNLDPDIRWELDDVINHVFPSDYQERSHEYAVKLVEFVLDNPGGVRKEDLSAFLEENDIPSSTAYNIVIPKLVKFGLFRRQREANESNPSKGWYMILKPSPTFASHLSKLADEWRSVYKTAQAKTEKEE